MEFNMLGLLQPYKAKDNCLKIYSHVYFFFKKMCFILGWKDLTCRIAHSLLTGSDSATVLPSFFHGLLR